MRVRQFTALDELAGVAPAWRELAEGRPFLSPEWLTTWWQEIGCVAGRRLAILVVSDERDEPVALAPWYLEQSRWHGATLRFLGSGVVCSEHLSVLCREGWQARVSAAMGDWLCARAGACRGQGAWDLLRLESTSAVDPMIGELCLALAARGARPHIESAASCWRLALPDTWDAYLGQLSKSHRKRVRRLEREYFQSGRARLVTATTQAQLAEGFRLLVEMHGQRWAACGQSGVFRDEALFAFHRAATSRLLAAGLLRLTWLELDGRAVAAEYSLQGGREVFAYQSGMLPDAAADEPGTLALIGTLREAIAAGAQVVDFLRGDEAYKRHWRAEPHAMQQICVLPDRWPGRVRHRLWQAASYSKRILRGRAVG